VVVVDVGRRAIDIEGVDVADRLRDWSPPEPRYRTGVFAKYAAQVTSASDGAVTRP
jgi:dihydroxy-acid dehydratase